MNIHRINPWLTYSPVLQTIREAGTFCKLFDFVDERALLGPEVALCTQFLMQKEGMPPYPRQPECFLATVERELTTAPVVYDGHLGRMSAPLNFEALQVVVQPHKHTIPARMLQAAGCGKLADWLYLGRTPNFWGQSSVEARDMESATRRQYSLHAVGNRSFVAMAPIPGQHMEYHSKTNNRWMPCIVSKVDPASGSIMVDVKPGIWITVQQQISCMRQMRDHPSAETSGPEGDYSSQQRHHHCPHEAPASSSASSSDSPMPALGHRNCRNWSVEDVAQYLEQIELKHVIPKFRENGVDGLMLHELSEEDLMTELGCTKLQARKIMRQTTSNVRGGRRRAKSHRRGTT